MRVIEVGTKLWKKAYCYDDNDRLQACIIELEVVRPGICAEFESGADRSFITRYRNVAQKCRVRAAKVLSIKAIDDRNNELSEYTVASRTTRAAAHSSRDKRFLYIVGETVVPYFEFDGEDVACASGIHGFETIEQAMEYTL